MARGEVGGFWRRGVALVVDGVAGLLFQLPAFIVIAGGPTELAACDSGGGLCEQSAPAVTVAGGFLLLGGALSWMLVHVGLTATVGGSPGKLLLGLRVVRVDGRPLTRWVALGRLLATYVSSSFLALGYLFALTNSDRETFHDRLAKTRVLRDGRRRPAAGSPDLRRGLAAYSIAVVLAGALALAAGPNDPGPSPAQLAAAGAALPDADAAAGDVSTRPYSQLAAGDCVVADPERLAASEVVVVVDCAERHAGEIVGGGELAEGPWPGEEAAFELSVTLCSESFAAHTGSEWWQTVLELSVISPQSELGWNVDRDVLCVAYRPEPATGALTEPGALDWPGLVPSDTAPPGTCGNIVEELPGPLAVVDCNEPHQVEVLPAGPIDLPGYDTEAIALTADEQCRRSFAAWVGVSYESSSLDMSYTFPSFPYAFDRDPIARCFVETPDVLGSVQASGR